MKMLYPIRWVELPDCPTCPHPLPEWTPLAVGGVILGVVALAIVAILIYRKINANRDVRMEIEKTKQKQLDYDMLLARNYSGKPDG